MKKYNMLSSVLLVFVFLSLFTVTVSANSSWYWISETRPHDLLPFVIILTLVIEVLLIYFIPKVNALPKTVFFVMLANVLSFASPYLFIYTIPSLYTFEQTLEHLPFYIVGVVYLIITLSVEIPIVYFALRKYSYNSKKLLVTVFSANFVTTVLTAIIERTLCKGSW